MVQKIIINRGNSRFRFSQKALEYMYNKKVAGVVKQSTYNIKYGVISDDIRTNKHAVKIVEELGPDASADLALLKVVEIPKGVKWSIVREGNAEYIREDAREWRG